MNTKINRLIVVIIVLVGITQLIEASARSLPPVQPTRPLRPANLPKPPIAPNQAAAVRRAPPAIPISVAPEAARPTVNLRQLRPALATPYDGGLQPAVPTSQGLNLNSTRRALPAPPAGVRPTGVASRPLPTVPVETSNVLTGKRNVGKLAGYATSLIDPKYNLTSLDEAKKAAREVNLALLVNKPGETSVKIVPTVLKQTALSDVYKTKRNTWTEKPVAPKPTFKQKVSNNVTSARTGLGSAFSRVRNPLRRTK